MKKLLFLVAILCAFKTNAQNYLINFAAAGASPVVNSVKVENLTQNTFLTLSGSDILQLTTSTGIKTDENNQYYDLKIYPNPMTHNSILKIYPPESGNGVISVLDMTGRPIIKDQFYLENSLQEFKVSGLKSGFYIIDVKGRNFQYSGKLKISALNINYIESAL